MRLILPGNKNLFKNISKIQPFDNPGKIIPLYIPGKGDNQFMAFTAQKPFQPASFGSAGITCTSEAEYLLITSAAGTGNNAGSYRTNAMNLRYLDCIFVRMYADGDMARIIEYGAIVAQNTDGSGSRYGVSQKTGAGWVRIDLQSVTGNISGYVHTYLVTNDLPGTSLIKVCSAYAVVTDDTPEPAV